MRGEGGTESIFMVAGRNLVQSYGRSWAAELTVAIEGPMLDAAGTSTTHRGWWWLWLLLLLLLSNMQFIAFGVAT
jgi:hypothetical protein